MTKKLSLMAAAAAVCVTAVIGATGSASAQTVSRTVPSKATWLAAVTTALKGGTTYLDGKEHSVPKPAIVLDIDNTALESYYQPFVATPPVLAFEQRAVHDGYQVLIATGRSADSGGTLEQLTKAGYHVDQLCFRDPKAASVQASKTACRAKWTAAGDGIIANVGNHTSDLAGGNSGKQYLLPNYGFLD